MSSLKCLDVVVGHFNRKFCMAFVLFFCFWTWNINNAFFNCRLWLFPLIKCIPKITCSATTVASVAVKLLHLLQKQKQQTLCEFKNTFRQNNTYSIYGNLTAWVESRGLFLLIKWNLGLTKTCQPAVSLNSRPNSIYQPWSLKRNTVRRQTVCECRWVGRRELNDSHRFGLCSST